MVATVTDLRSRSFAECAYLFVPDGLPYAWVTDHDFRTASLLGSGAGTWSSTLPSSVGPRTILRGLELPEFHESIDIKTGLLDSSQVSIRLTDFGGELVSLFATEGKDYDILHEAIAPGITPLGTSITVQGGLTVNPRGRNIGTERIGPAGERCYYSCFPFTRIGPQHPVNSLGVQEEGPPPISISADPIEFVGRWCAVYRLYRDYDESGYLSWPGLQEQYDAGGLLWWGKLLDRGSVDANRVWSLSVAGPESFLRKTCNQLSFGWTPIAGVATTLTDEERYVGIEFLTTSGTNEREIRNSIGFLELQQLTAAGTKDTWISELNTLLTNVGTGGLVGYGPDGNFSAYNNAEAQIGAAGQVRIRRDFNAASTGSIQCNFVLHEKVWRALGFDPALQDVGAGEPEVDAYQSHWTQIGQGDNVSIFAPADSGAVPIPNYWRLKAHSTRLGADSLAFVPFLQADQSWQYNYGNWREFFPLLEGEPLLLPVEVGDGAPIRLSLDALYVEGQPTISRRSTARVNGASTNRARYFALRGKRQPGIVTANGDVIDPDTGDVVAPADVESDDEKQVVRCSWRDASVFGSVVAESDFATFVAERWQDPRPYGINRIPITGEWAAEQDPTGEFSVEMAPLAVYGTGYGNGMGEPTPSHQVLFQILLSTGTAAGWDSDEATLTEFEPGLNAHPGQATDWCTDAEVWDMGLCIPHQLVQEPDDAVLEFDNLPNGGRDSNFNRQAFAFVGPYESLDVITSIIQPRGLALSLRGNRYSLVHLGPFAPDEADFVITEASLWGDLNDPTSVQPRQQVRAIGQLDVVRMAHRGDPIEGGTQKEATYRARDTGALYRQGDLELAITDLGLTPSVWHSPGVPGWETDALQFWSQQRAEFFSRRHFKLTRVLVKRVAGQDIRVGARVRITNPWPVNPSGSYGITNAVGIVTDWTFRADRDQTELEILVFADQFDGLRVFMPVGKFVQGAAGWTPGTSTITLVEDFLGHGQGADAARFMDQDGLGEARVRIVSYNRREWSVSAVYTILSRSGNAITLSSVPTDILRDTDKYLIPAEWDQQTTANWPHHRGSVVTLASTYFGSVPTKGWPLFP